MMVVLFLFVFQCRNSTNLCCQSRASLSGVEIVSAFVSDETHLFLHNHIVGLLAENYPSLLDSRVVITYNSSIVTWLLRVNSIWPLTKCQYMTSWE